MPLVKVVKAARCREKVAIALVFAIRRGPAGERPGGFIDILVDVALRLAIQRTRHLAPLAVEMIQVVLGTECVQFEKLARIVLVGRAGFAAPVVQVVEHRQALPDRLEHLTEISQRMLADHIPVVSWPNSTDDVVRADVDIEVIVPKIHKQLAHLPL